MEGGAGLCVAKGRERLSQFPREQGGPGWGSAAVGGRGALSLNSAGFGTDLLDRLTSKSAHFPTQLLRWAKSLSNQGHREGRESGLTMPPSLS